MLEQDRAEARLIRRDKNGTIVELGYGLDDVISLEALDISIAMQSIYEGAWRQGIVGLRLRSATTYALIYPLGVVPLALLHPKWSRRGLVPW